MLYEIGRGVQKCNMLPHSHIVLHPFFHSIDGSGIESVFLWIGFVKPQILNRFSSTNVLFDLGIGLDS